MSKLPLHDRLQVVTSGAFVLLGAVVLVRTALVGAWLGTAFGGAMLALGLYRGHLLLQILREVRR